MATYNHLSDGRPDGALVGNDVSDPVGFHGTAPTAHLTVATVSLGGYGYATSAGAEAAHALLVEIRAALVAKGIIKGAA